MSGPSTFVPKSALGRWFESRLPIMGLIHSSFVAFPNPRNLNYFWTFGGILAFMLVAQIVTGIVLVMHYTPEATMAFNSVEHIMRDVNYGWLMRYAHSNGASMFFIAVYIHILRGMYYGSYKAPREVLWILGVIIYLLMMATGVHGLRAALGPDEFLGRDRHHQPVLGHPLHRRDGRDTGSGAATRSITRRSTASSRCIICCPS